MKWSVRGFLSHVPTIMLPEAVRRELNDGNEISLVPGLERLRTEVLDELRPDVVIVFDTHWVSLFEFIVTAQERRVGTYTSEEVPRGLNQVHYDMLGRLRVCRSSRSGCKRCRCPLYCQRRFTSAGQLRHCQYRPIISTAVRNGFRSVSARQPLTMIFLGRDRASAPLSGNRGNGWCLIASGFFESSFSIP